LDFTVDHQKAVGQKIGDISPTDDFIIVAVYENGNIQIPRPDMVLEEGTKVSMVVKTKFARDVMKRFTRL
jgi:trk system potassium uptake protein TrkA